MAEAGWGRVVLFGSKDAEQPYVDKLPCCGVEAAILNFSRSLSKTCAKRGVLVNAVLSAFIATLMTNASDGEARKRMALPSTKRSRAS